MVINYKALNKETIDDGYFLPKKEEPLTLIRGNKYFSGLDCKSGFWQVRLEEESQLLTAFSCPHGQYHWKVVPFGLKQAPGIFERHMDNIFKNIIYSVVFMLMIFSSSVILYRNISNTLKLSLKNAGIRESYSLKRKQIWFRPKSNI